jgi:Cu2+-exporting ATPase
MAAAEQARGKYVRLADRAARLYAPAVHTLGLVTFIGWLLAGYDWEHALVAAIAVLIITCPCALALAVPAVQVAATSRLFGRGILVKAPDALERLAEIDTVVFDKTGTLTLGQPVLAERGQIDDATLMRAAQIASASRHPYARAVVEAAAARGLSIKSAGQVSETPGFGLELAGADGHERLGSAAWCAVEHNGNEASLYYRAADGRNTPFYFEDPLRSDAAQVVAQLRGAGIAVELLSGDRASVVQAAAAAAGITDWTGGALPTDKIERLKKLRTQAAKVLMVGDGLNDAPALAAAHASLSPASAADVSQTAADAIFQGEALRPVLETVAVARVAQRMALQNFGISIAYNLIFVPLAVLGIVTPLLAAIAMSASSIAVTVNAARLRTRRLGTIR